MLVTPESAVSPDFQTFLNRLRWTRRLDRIVIDECHMARTQMVIIYANIIGQVTAMARVFGCKVYYSEQLDKAGVLAQFMGASPVIAATSALGMGVDIPNIRSIIHIGTPRTLLDYAQESGRAGWDGQRSEVIIIQLAGWDAPAPWMEGVALEDQEQVAEYMGVVEGVGCRRVVL
ncbi:putative helicase, partial [Aspergillus udagawae]